jgi:hypothetical protein
MGLARSQLAADPRRVAKQQPVPDEDAPDREPASYGAVMSPFGVMTVVPRPESPGRAKPEPEERWTLGPGGHEEPDAGKDPEERS